MKVLLQHTHYLLEKNESWPYTTVENMVLTELNKTLSEVKTSLPDTYNFLLSLQDGLANIGYYQ